MDVSCPIEGGGVETWRSLLALRKIISGVLWGWKPGWGGVGLKRSREFDEQRLGGEIQIAVCWRLLVRNVLQQRTEKEKERRGDSGIIGGLFFT